jgi:hypothetical protein
MKAPVRPKQMHHTYWNTMKIASVAVLWQAEKLAEVL